jgi:hypothetical protein
MSSTSVEPKGPQGPEEAFETSVFPVSTPDAVDEKTVHSSKIHNVSSGDHSDESDRESKDVIIVTGADAARHLLPMRDDHDNALTFRSMLLSSGLACFQAVMYQIYIVSRPGSSIVSTHH